MAIEIAHNHPDSLPFVEAVGKLIQNMGMIEFQTYEWISILQEDPMVLELARRSRLRDRIEIIRKMISRADFLSEAEVIEYRDLWASVVQHSEIRNIVAHNGTMMGFPNNDASQAPHVIGVVNFKPRDKSREAELVLVDEINGSVNATYQVGIRILELGKALAERKSDVVA